MTRFTKEIRKLGFKIESDYEYLPCGDIETAYTKSERAEYCIFHYGLGLIRYRFNRDMSFETIYED